MSYRRLATTLFLLAFVTVSRSVRAADAPAAPDVLCAIVADGGDRAAAPLAALVQTKLDALPGTRWVERVEIDRVLAEQQVATALGADNGRERVRLGQLLKAQVLVLLRPAAAPAKGSEERPPAEPGVHVVIAETRAGLRLLSRAVPAAPGAEAAAADAVVALVSEGVRKAREPVRAICAVPPFVSNDLTYEFDYLKAAYANLIAQALLDRPGVVVVELDEARAIAAEIARAGGGGVARRLPIYVLGEYRNAAAAAGAAAAAAPTQTVRITVKRGDAQIEQLDRRDLAPPAAAAFVREAAARVATLAGGGGEAKAPVVADGNAEARQLGDRASIHRRLGDWDQAAALTEAALLLKPDDAELHRQAIIIYEKITRRAAPNHGERTAENVHRRAANYFRGLEHLEIFLRTAGDLGQYRVSGGSNFAADFLHAGSWTETGNPHEKPAEWRKALAECAAREREVMLRIAHMRARDRRGDEHGYVIHALWGLSEPEQYQMIWEFLDATKDLPGARARAIRLAPHGYVNDVLDSPEGRKLIERLIASGHPELRPAGETLRRMVEVAKAAREARVAEETKQFAATRPATTGPAEIEFKPIRFRVENAPDRTFESVGGVIRAGDGMDVMWRGSSFYVMKQKDVLRPIWSTDEMNVWVKSVAFDGRYVWVTAQRHKNSPLLLALDPGTGQSWEVTAAHGLPLDATPASEHDTHHLKVAGVTPGMAIVAGSFGRTWLATVTLDPKTGPRGKVFHEATAAPNREDKEQWRQTSLSFYPSYLVTLGNDDAAPADKRVLIGRREAPYGRTYNPLAINPATLAVDVLPELGLAHDETTTFWTVHEGALYWARPTWRRSGERPRPNIYRMALPDLKQTTVATRVHDGEQMYRDTLAFFGGRVHLLARDWWCADALDQPFRMLRGDVPHRFRMPPNGRSVTGLTNKETEQIQALLYSNHYGLLAQVHRNSPPSSTYQVVFPVEGGPTAPRTP